MPRSRSLVAGARAIERLLGRSRAACRGDLVRARERLKAAAVAARAPRAIGIDRLVAELAARAVVALVDVAVDGQHATNACTQRQADHRRRAAPGAQAQLGQPECAGVVDQVRRQLEGLADHGRPSACPSTRRAG